MFPTRHPGERYKQRVAPVSTAKAFRALAAMATARRRITPGWWTPVGPTSGVLLYPASMPGVCLLIRDGATVTVFVRSQCPTWKDERTVRGRRRALRRPYRRLRAGTRRDAAT